MQEVRNERMAGAHARMALALPAVALLLAGCSLDLTPQSLVDKFRVIAIKADPASGIPGQTVSIEAVMSDTSTGVPPLVVWAACFPLPGQSGRQCLESAMDPSSGGGQFELLGLEPTATFLLPGLGPEEQSKDIFIVFAACSGAVDFPDCECPGPDCERCMGEVDLFSFCMGDEAIVYKNVSVVAEASAGNTNPGIEDVLLDGEPWAQDDVPQIECGPDIECPSWTLALSSTPESAETWTEIRFGEEVSFTEEPYVSWFATAGDMDKIRSSVEGEERLAEVKWSPTADDEGAVTFWFVLYDGRGGLDWRSRTAAIVLPPSP